MTKMQTNCTTTLGKVNTPISTAVAWREKKSKHFVFYKYFCLVLGVDIEIFWTAD